MTGIVHSYFIAESPLSSSHTKMALESNVSLQPTKRSHKSKTEIERTCTSLSQETNVVRKKSVLPVRIVRSSREHMPGPPVMPGLSLRVR